MLLQGLSSEGKNVIMSIILGLFMIPVVINIIPLYINAGKFWYAQFFASSDADISDLDYTIEHTFIEKLL